MGIIEIFLVVVLVLMVISAFSPAPWGSQPNILWIAVLVILIFLLSGRLGYF